MWGSSDEKKRQGCAGPLCGCGCLLLLVPIVGVVGMVLIAALSGRPR